MYGLAHPRLNSFFADLEDFLPRRPEGGAASPPQVKEMSEGPVHPLIYY